MLCNVYNLSILNLVFSFLYSLPHTQLCSVLLWACASALQTLLKSLSGSTRSSSGSPLSSVPFASSPPFFTTLFAFSCEILYCFCFSLVFVVMVLLPSKFEWSHFYHLLSLGVTEPHRSHFAATFVFVILRSVEDTKCSKWKQVVLSNLTLKALLFLCWFSFFLSFLFFFFTNECTYCWWFCISTWSAGCYRLCMSSELS